MMTSAEFTIDLTGKCSSCSNNAAPAEIISCESCKKIFHALCPSVVNKQDGICNISFLKLWHSGSKKSNFKWYCDPCLTHMEHSQFSDFQTKFFTLIEKVNDLTNEVKSLSGTVGKQNESITVLNSEIASLKSLKNDDGKNGESSNVAFTSPLYGGSWSNPKSVQNLKASLVVKPVSTESPINIASIEKIAVKHRIPVSRVGVASNGNTFVHCPTKAARDKLQPLLTSDLPEQTVMALKDKMPSISIAGITKEVSKEELLIQICNQNEYISDLIGQGNEFKILFVKAPSAGYSNYQVVVRLSPSIRSAIASRNNRLFLGLTTCRVHDRFYVKRCNKCNCFGHYKSDCTNSTACGYCMKDDHESIDCPLRNSKDTSVFKCSNCHKAGLDHEGHSALWFNCPSYKSAQKRLQSSIPYYDSVKN